MIREKVTRMLESEFDTIGAVMDGEALLKEATELDPDIVILDITLVPPSQSPASGTSS